MAEELEFVDYKDISELKKELEGMKAGKDDSQKGIYDAVQKLANVIDELLDVFAAAAEQLKLEEKQSQSDAKKHEMIISKLDKVIVQNKTIAEGMVAIVDMLKEKTTFKEEAMFKPVEESLFKPKPEPSFMAPQDWKPKEMPRMQPMPTPQTFAPPSTQPFMPPTPTPVPDFGMKMPSMEPEPTTDLEALEEPTAPEEPQKKKSLFGMFKK